MPTLQNFISHSVAVTTGIVSGRCNNCTIMEELLEQLSAREKPLNRNPGSDSQSFQLILRACHSA